MVAEGSWNAAGTEFDSDRLLVKHTEDYKKADTDQDEYESEHPDRVVDEADLEEPDEAAAGGPSDRHSTSDRGSSAS